MGELTLNLVRLGVIVLLWAFVFSVVGVLRGDLYGTRVSRNAGPARPTRETRTERRQRKNNPTHVVVTEGRLRGILARVLSHAGIVAASCVLTSL